MANFNRSSKAGKVKSKAGKDFQLLRSHMADRWGPVRLGNSIQRVRTVFKYGYEVGLIVNPVRYGPSFKKPPARVIRNNRKNKMLTAGECRSLIDAAPAPVKAMVLLGLNCGFGNHDCATLPETAIDLKAGWVDYRRTKTGIVRRYPLWPETISALEETAAIRPIPKTEDAKGLVFVTVRGRP